MLSEATLQLLTAFIDGELSPGKRVEVLRLLEKSSEARAVLMELQENAHKIKSLRRYKVEPSLVDSIVEAINESKSRPKPISHRRGRRWLPYVAAAMAASLLIGAIGVAFWKATRPADVNNRNDFVENRNDDKKGEVKPPVEVPTPKRPNPWLAELAKITDTTVRDFGAPILEDKIFSASFADLKKGGKATPQFAQELNRGRAVQLEITVKKNSEALKRLQMVTKYQDIKLIADPVAARPQDNKQVQYLVYAENLTTDELTKLVNELSDNYVEGTKNNQKNMTTPFQKVTVAPLAKEEKQQVAKLLGVDAATMERKVDKSAKAERTVVLLPATGGAKQSNEMRQFVNQRREVRPDAVQILIKIRQE
jgi:hypothetical protein